MMLDMVDIRTSRHKVVLLFSHNEDHFYAGDDGYYDNVSRFEALSGSEAVLEVCVFFMQLPGAFIITIIIIAMGIIFQTINNHLKVCFTTRLLCAANRDLK